MDFPFALASEGSAISMEPFQALEVLFLNVCIIFLDRVSSGSSAACSVHLFTDVTVSARKGSEIKEAACS